MRHALLSLIAEVARRAQWFSRQVVLVLCPDDLLPHQCCHWQWLCSEHPQLLRQAGHFCVAVLTPPAVLWTATLLIW
jgi:hypothetical protein